MIAVRSVVSLAAVMLLAGCLADSAKTVRRNQPAASTTAAAQQAEGSGTEVEPGEPATAAELALSAEELEALILNAPDDNAALSALDTLRRVRIKPLLALLDVRISRALARNDHTRAVELARERERYELMMRGNALPGFLRTPPPLFQAKTGNRQRTRVAIVGDFGTGDATQRAVANAMAHTDDELPFELGITLGDNFYSYGVKSPDDSLWNLRWHEMYDGLGITFFASLGNHDWGYADSPAAEILHTGRHTGHDESWRMPAAYYTFTAGPVQFFALDTYMFSQAQRMWLDAAIRDSRAPWKVVYGHHPIYSHGAHGDGSNLIQSLLPMLRNRVDAYIAGHEHDLQHLKPEAGVHFFILGGGGQGTRPILAGDRSLFAASANGFGIIDADAARMSLTVVSADEAVLYRYTIAR